MGQSATSRRCPTSEQLEAFVAARSESGPIAEHVSSCDTCTQVVQEIRNNDSFLLGARDSLIGLFNEEPPKEQAPPTGAAIPGYQILGEVARGGQGVILRAVQDATKRKVAIKMALAGVFATARQRHRFAREIEIVAALRHPNIVTLYDSGTTPDGRDFVAMEYIHGVPLDRYCKERCGAPGDRERVRRIAALFAKVARAVQHAHARGVIHRDLKPGNILVDDGGEPHILDFGLARPLIRGQGLTRTVTNEFLGTPAYASPEQVQGDPERIDARSDVYSLGFMLYVAITGVPPYPVHGAIPEVLKHITSTEPVQLSRIQGGIPGDLSIIILHALAKEPDRRYQSAGTFASDLEDYLAGRPISARRDSALYLLRKTAER